MVTITCLPFCPFSDRLEHQLVRSLGCNGLGADRRPGRGEDRAAAEGQAGRAWDRGAGHGEGPASSCRANGPPGAEAGRGVGR